MHNDKDSPGSNIRRFSSGDLLPYYSIKAVPWRRTVPQRSFSAAIVHYTPSFNTPPLTY